MLSPVPGPLPFDSAVAPAALERLHDSAAGEETLKERFQEAVAGTFYRQMLQSLRKMHGKPAYLHGGRAEEVFRSHLDQQVADDLAQEHGAAFSDPLFDSFAARLRSRAAE